MYWKSDEGIPDRRMGLVAGIIGGLVGIYAMRAYWQQVAPLLFPPSANPDNPYLNATPSIALVGEQYQEGETSTEVLGRLVYEGFTGGTPPLAERSAIGDKALLVWGIIAGTVYGATRTTTRARDIAGGFFYGIRLWLGDMWMPSLLGLRPPPASFTYEQHLWRLSAIWVYSFTTTAATRILYRLLGGQV